MKINDPATMSILKKHNCLNCHSLMKNWIMPSFYEISKKYKNNIENKKYLFKKIKLGSKGVWNNKFIMPSNYNISSKSIKRLVKWILNIKLLMKNFL